MPRIIEDIAVKAPARTQASVVDTFVRPVAPESPLGATGGRALMNAFGVVSKIAQKKEEERKERERLAGELEGLKLSAKEDGPKIADGMFPNASPAFMAGLHESMGQADAYRAVASLKGEYSAWIKDNPEADLEPTMFQDWLASQSEAFTQGLAGNQYRTAGALPVYRMGLSNLMQSHVADAATRVEEREYEALEQIVTGKAEQHDWSDDPDGLALIGAISREADVRVGKGLSGTQVNDTVVEGLINLSRASNDTRYLNALVNAHEAGTYRLSSKQFADVETAEDVVSGELARAEAGREAARKKAEDNARDQYLSGYIQQLLSDPTAMPDPRVLKIDPDIYTAALTVRSKIASAANEGDPVADQANTQAVLAYVYAPENKGKPYNDKIKAVSEYLSETGLVVNESTLGRIYSQLGREHAPSAAIKNPSVADSMKIYQGFLKASLGDTSFGETKAVEPAFEAAFRSNMAEVEGQLEAQGKTILDLTPAQRREASTEAAHAAIRSTILNQGDPSSLFEEGKPALLKFLRNVGIDTAPYEDKPDPDRTTDAGAEFDKAEAEESVGEEPTPAAEKNISEAPTLGSLEDLAAAEGIGDVDVQVLAQSLFEQAAFDGVIPAEFTSEDIAAYTNALMAEWLSGGHQYPRPEEFFNLKEE